VIEIWRVLTASAASQAYTGEGARLFGGRWNSCGTPMIYAAAHISTALLEISVLDRLLQAPYVIVPATIPAAIKRSTIQVEQLPTNWRQQTGNETLRRLGDDWQKSMASAVLVVPSAIVPQESLYLLNPKHNDFGHIRVDTAFSWTAVPGHPANAVSTESGSAAYR
jgi:RES domain-containing protein